MSTKERLLALGHKPKLFKMKKVLLLAAAVATSALVFGQELVSKKGEAYLPQEGDYALGFDAVPLFNVLKFNNANTIGSAGPSEYGAISVFGKKFHSATEACRFGLILNTGSSRTVTEVADLSSGAGADDRVDNVVRNSNFNLTLVAGKEFRRGSTRVQGLWGAEGMVSIGSNRTKTTLGNDLADLDNVALDGTVIDTKSGLAFGVGARAFIGVEYFVAPKLSVALEAGLGLALNFQPKGKVTTLEDDGTTLVEEENDGTVKGSNVTLGTGYSGGAVKVMFHF